MAQILAVAVAVDPDGEVRRQHPAPPEEHVDPEAGIAVGGGVGGRHDADERREEEQLVGFGEAVFEPGLAGSLVVEQVVIAGAEADEAGLFRGRREDTRKQGRKPEQQSSHYGNPPLTDPPYHSRVPATGKDAGPSPAVPRRRPQR